MPGLLVNGYTPRDFTTVSNPSSSDDERPNGNGAEYTYIDVFDLPPPRDGRFNLLLVDAGNTERAFARRNCIIGMRLEDLKPLAHRFLRKDPATWDVHFHYTKTCIGPLTHPQFESRFLLAFAIGNATVPVYAHFYQYRRNPDAIELFPRSRRSIQREARRERSGEVMQDDPGSEQLF